MAEVNCVVMDEVTATADSADYIQEMVGLQVWHEGKEEQSERDRLKP